MAGFTVLVPVPHKYVGPAASSLSTLNAAFWAFPPNPFPPHRCEPGGNRCWGVKDRLHQAVRSRKLWKPTKTDTGNTDFYCISKSCRIKRVAALPHILSSVHHVLITFFSVWFPVVKEILSAQRKKFYDQNWLDLRKTSEKWSWSTVGGSTGKPLLPYPWINSYLLKYLGADLQASVGFWYHRLGYD